MKSSTLMLHTILGQNTELLLNMLRKPDSLKLMIQSYNMEEGMVL